MYSIGCFLSRRVRRFGDAVTERDAFEDATDVEGALEGVGLVVQSLHRLAEGEEGGTASRNAPDHVAEGEFAGEVTATKLPGALETDRRVDPLAVGPGGDEFDGETTVPVGDMRPLVCREPPPRRECLEWEWLLVRMH
ncbi:hypothetical protein GCM10025298_22970 [Natronobiforma cellulositropha]